MGTVPEERRRLPVPWRPAQADSKVLAAADLAIGLGSEAIDFARSLVVRAGKPLLQPAAAPVAGVVRTAVSIAERSGLRQQAQEIAERGRRERVALTSAATRAVLGLVPEVTAAVLDQLDLTSMVAERVDLNAVVRDLDVDQVVNKVDIDEVAARIDVKAIVERVDIAGLARYVIEEVDLPEIIRSSTDSITSDTVRGMRMQSIAADERLGRIVDRALLRRRPRQTFTPRADGSAGNAGSDGERPEPRA
jgi:hypothetical protein